MQRKNNTKGNANGDAATTERIYGVYIRSMLTTKLAIPITAIGKNIKQNLEKVISKRAEGKCIPEGFVKPDSINILTYSSGNVMGQNVEFCTTYECLICNPVEGMMIDCMTKTITKAGIHAEVVDEKGNVPITIFVARDHHYKNTYFNDIKENEKIQVRVIGVRYELNDTYISVIAKLIEPQLKNAKPRARKTGGAIMGDAATDPTEYIPVGHIGGGDGEDSDSDDVSSDDE
jgi:DNA-directed RNA polymerase subunit E'/Rpb7